MFKNSFKHIYYRMTVLYRILGSGHYNSTLDWMLGTGRETLVHLVLSTETLVHLPLVVMQAVWAVWKVVSEEGQGADL